MRDNSGKGDGHNNNHDPTLKELEGRKGPAQRSGRMMEGGAGYDIAGNAEVRGEKPSPSDRARGEGGPNQPAAPVEADNR